MPETTKDADATQTGVSEVAKTGILDLNDPTVHYGREQAMASMRQRRREKVLEDMDPTARAEYEASTAAASAATATSTATTTTEDDDPEAAAAEAERQRLAREAEAAGTGTETTTETPQRGQVERQAATPRLLAADELGLLRVKKKVLGEEVEVSVADLLSEAQRYGAGDVYLEKAKQILADVNARLDAVDAAAKKDKDGTATTTTETAQPADPAKIKAAVGTALDQMFRGKEADATETLTNAILAVRASQPEAARVDPSSLAEVVASEIAKSSALRRFAKDNPEIMSDDLRRVVADRLLNRELKELGVTRLEQLPPDQIDEVVEVAGRKTREFLGLKPAAPKPRPSGANGTEATTLSERRVRKEKIDELPSAATRASITEAAPRSTSDVIASMARARGQVTDPNERTH